MKIAMVSFGPIESRSNGYFIRCSNMSKGLANLGHNVLVLEFQENRSLSFSKLSRRIAFLHLAGNEINRNRVSRVLMDIFTFDPLHVTKFQLYSIVELIRFRHFLQSCSVVFLEGGLIPFAPLLAKIAKKKIVLDTHCMNKLLASHFRDRSFSSYFLRKTLWGFLERFVITTSDVIITVSEGEKRFVEKEYHVPKSKTFVIPNFVLREAGRCSDDTLSNLRKKWGLEGRIVITFVGDLNAVQNRDAVGFITKILAPHYQKARKDVVFLIIGKGEDNYERTPANMVFTGFVKDLAPFLDASDICIAPLRVGAGTKTKVLEYLAYGRPVVATPVGVEGIDVSDQSTIIISKIADFKSKLTEAICLLDRPRLNKPTNVAVLDYSFEHLEKDLRIILENVVL